MTRAAAPPPSPAQAWTAPTQLALKGSVFFGLSQVSGYLLRRADPNGEVSHALASLLTLCREAAWF